MCDEAEAKKPLDCRVEFKDMALGLVDLVGLNDDPETSFIFQTAADEEDDDNEGDFNDFNHDEDDEDVDEDAGTKKKATRKATVTSVVHVPESARPRSTRAAAVVATLNIVTEHEEEAEVQEEEDSPEKPAKKKTKVAATTATLSKRKAKK